MLNSLSERFAPYLPLALRLLVGIVFVAHGLQKLANCLALVVLGSGTVSIERHMLKRDM